MTSVFDKFFPVPDFLRMPVVGISFSDTALVYSEVRRKKTLLHVDTLQSIALTQGDIVHGEIQNGDALVAQIRSIAKATSSSFAAISIPEDIVYTFTLTIPKVDHHEIPAAIEFQLEEHIPIAPEELIVDFDVLHEGAFKQTIKVSAIEKKHYNAYREVLALGGLSLVHVESDMESLARITALPHDAPSMLVVAHPQHLRIGLHTYGALISTTTQPIEHDINKDAVHACEHIHQYIFHDLNIQDAHADDAFTIRIVGDPALRDPVSACMSDAFQANVLTATWKEEIDTWIQSQSKNMDTADMVSLGVSYSSLMYD